MVLLTFVLTLGRTEEGRGYETLAAVTTADERPVRVVLVENRDELTAVHPDIPFLLQSQEIHFRAIDCESMSCSTSVCSILKWTYLACFVKSHNVIIQPAAENQPLKFQIGVSLSLSFFLGGGGSQFSRDGNKKDCVTRANRDGFCCFVQACLVCWPKETSRYFFDLVIFCQCLCTPTFNF